MDRLFRLSREGPVLILIEGTIDPFHVEFRFSGVDACGQPMSSKAGQYTGFSGFA